MRKTKFKHPKLWPSASKDQTPKVFRRSRPNWKKHFINFCFSEPKVSTWQFSGWIWWHHHFAGLADCLLNCQYLKIRSFHINNTDFWLLLGKKKNQKIWQHWAHIHAKQMRTSETPVKIQDTDGVSINSFLPSLSQSVSKSSETCITSWRHLPESKL